MSFIDTQTEWIHLKNINTHKYCYFLLLLSFCISLYVCVQSHLYLCVHKKCTSNWIISMWQNKLLFGPLLWIIFGHYSMSYESTNYNY